MSGMDVIFVVVLILLIGVLVKLALLVGGVIHEDDRMTGRLGGRPVQREVSALSITVVVDVGIAIVVLLSCLERTKGCL